MRRSRKQITSSSQATSIYVVECGKEPPYRMLRCAIGENLIFNTLGMESFFFAQWNPVVFDAFVVAAAVEFCDKTKLRPTQDWGRYFSLHIPVHDPDLWSKNVVAESLRSALDFLTGDRWNFSFYPREHPEPQPQQSQFDLGCNISAVIPFSNGLDSWVAAGLAAHKLGDRLVRIRLGSKKIAPNEINLDKEPFTAVPYAVRKGVKGFRESSGRSRGFKVALVSGIAAFLSGAERIIVPESGQGALGPSLIPVGQVAPDYRSHPRFGRKMEKFLHSLIGFEGRYVYPHIWNTKGETLARYITETGDRSNWTNTRSCWQQNRHVGVEGKARQCGICAACMLRRLSVHAAGQDEHTNTYVWEDLGARHFEAGASSEFDKAKITLAMKQHAIAGTLHADHLAALRGLPASSKRVKLESFWLGQVFGMHNDTVEGRLKRLLAQHKTEWKNFKAALGSESFINDWIP